MAKKETAEQKLLRMIEDSGGAAATPGEPSVVVSDPARDIAAAVKGTGVSVPAVFPFFVDRLQGFLKLLFGRSFGLKQINAALIAFIVVAALGMGFFYKNESSILSRAVDFSKDIKASDVTSALGILPQYKPLAAFLETITERNIFRPYEKKEELPSNVAPGAEKIALKIKGLKLVGISWLDVPDSASIMVENPDGATVFLKEKDTVSGVLVKKIFADRVIFTYEGQEMEMRL